MEDFRVEFESNSELTLAFAPALWQQKSHENVFSS